MVDTRSKIMRLIAGVALLGTAATSQAAVVDVSGGGDALKNAWAAAPNGNILRITDSLTYNGGIYLDGKDVDIVAAAGQSPTIQPDGANSYIFQVSTTGAGSQIGALGTGQIIINTNSTVGDVFRCLHDSPAKFVAQNIQINFAHTGAGVFPRDNTNGDIELTEVHFNGNPAVPDQQFIRVDQLNGRTFSLIRCDMRNLPPLALGASSWAVCGFGSTGGTLNIDSCVIDSGTHPTLVREVILFDSGGNTTGMTININNSWIQRRMAGNFQTLRIRSPNQTLNMTNSVLTNAADFVALDLILTPDNSTVNLDHCDFISLENTLRFYEFTGGTLSVTNCNIIQLNSSGAGFYFNNGNFTTRSANYNNIYGGNDPYHGGAIAPGANDVAPPVDPAYMDMANGDFRLGAAALTTAGQGGSAVGSNRSFANVVPVELSTFNVM